jgi:NADH:ubiquinone oxidoreductase subunit 4 (subunit M)
MRLFCAAAQDDFKKMIAFSSITHMGLAFLAIVVDAHKGVDAAVFLMFSHDYYLRIIYLLQAFFMIIIILRILRFFQVNLGKRLILILFY